MKGFYDEHKLFKINHPTCPGWEGSGTIVASGGGPIGWWRTGMRVAFVRNVNGNEMIAGGAFQQYCLAKSFEVNPLGDEIPSDVGSMAFVNPLTAIGLLERGQELRAPAMIQTGAASQVGRMLIKLAKMQNMPLVNVVRRPEQVKMLQDEYGAEYVLDSSSADFFDQFKELVKKLRATVLIECIGGDFTAKLMDCLPSRSTTVLYGCLSE